MSTEPSRMKIDKEMKVLLKARMKGVKNLKVTREFSDLEKVKISSLVEYCLVLNTLTENLEVKKIFSNLFINHLEKQKNSKKFQKADSPMSRIEIDVINKFLASYFQVEDTTASERMKEFEKVNEAYLLDAILFKNCSDSVVSILCCMLIKYFGFPCRLVFTLCLSSFSIISVTHQYFVKNSWLSTLESSATTSVPDNNHMRLLKISVSESNFITEIFIDEKQEKSLKKIRYLRENLNPVKGTEEEENKIYDWFSGIYLVTLRQKSVESLYLSYHYRTYYSLSDTDIDTVYKDRVLSSISLSSFNEHSLLSSSHLDLIEPNSDCDGTDKGTVLFSKLKFREHIEYALIEEELTKLRQDNSFESDIVLGIYEDNDILLNSKYISLLYTKRQLLKLGKVLIDENVAPTKTRLTSLRRQGFRLKTSEQDKVEVKYYKLEDSKNLDKIEYDLDSNFIQTTEYNNVVIKHEIQVSEDLKHVSYELLKNDGKYKHVTKLFRDLSKVCLTLNLTYAPVVTSFEQQQSKTRFMVNSGDDFGMNEQEKKFKPVYDGCLIFKRDYELLKDALYEMDIKIEKEEMQKLYLLCIKRWTRLTKFLLLKQQISSKNNNINQGSSNESERERERKRHKETIVNRLKSGSKCTHSYVFLKKLSDNWVTQRCKNCHLTREIENLL